MGRLTEKELYDGKICFSECAKTECPDNCASCEVPKRVIEKLKEYEDLEEQGKLMKMPCKVGSIVYSLECGEIEPIAVSYFCNNKDGLWLINQFGGIIGMYEKTVFLTEKDAETALQKMKETEE